MVVQTTWWYVVVAISTLFPTNPERWEDHVKVKCHAHRCERAEMSWTHTSLHKVAQPYTNTNPTTIQMKDWTSFKSRNLGHPRTSHL
jgi:hypothetical protein